MSNQNESEYFFLGVTVTQQGTISAVVQTPTGAKPVLVRKDHPLFGECLEAARTGDAEAFLVKSAPVKVIEKSFAAATATGEITGKAEVRDGVVFYNGQEVNNRVVSYITRLIRDGFNPSPPLRFLERLYKNHSNRAINELWRFVESHNLALTDDGCILFYKRVKDNWTDFHSGQVDNRPGAVIPRKAHHEVCDDARVGCSHGYHVGDIAYVRGFYKNQGKIVICKVDPADVVSIPFDHNSDKVRVVWYQPVREATEEEIEGLFHALYDSVTTEPVPAKAHTNGDSPFAHTTPEKFFEFTSQDDDDDDDYDDDDDDDGDDGYSSWA